MGLPWEAVDASDWTVVRAVSAGAVVSVDIGLPDTVAGSRVKTVPGNDPVAGEPCVEIELLVEAVRASGWTVVRKLSGGTEAVCVEIELLWEAVDP